MALMAIRQIPLAQQIDGINLMRSKGGASASSLFDLQNGWVTSKRTVKARPGSVAEIVFPAGTIGDAGLEGKHHTFTHLAGVVATDPNVVVWRLIHPTGAASALVAVHRAFAFLGRLYVVAEFDDGVVQHYWLRGWPAWVASTPYEEASKVQPTVATGFVFSPQPVTGIAKWAADTEYAISDEVLPTVHNGYKYVLTSGTGTPLRSSSTEPTWPETAGATITEVR